MWFLLRVAFAGLIALLRYYWRTQSIDGAESWQNEIIYRRGNRRGETLWGLDINLPMVFELLVEHRADRWLKKLGVIIEQQTGDPSFDDRVYIRGDHPALGHVLAIDETGRAAVHALFDLGVKRVFSDGSRLWLEGSTPLASKNELLLALCRLRACLLRIGANKPDWPLMSLPWRIVAVEALVWGVATYAFSGFAELFRLGEVTLDIPRLISYSTVTAAIVGFVCISAVFATVHQSSWAKKILWEAGLVLTISVPIASVTLVLDANRLFDRSPLHSSVYEIIERNAYSYNRSVRGRNLAVITEYAVRVRPRNTSDPEIRRYLPVSRNTHDDQSAVITITWGDGAFGFPWIDTIGQISGNSATLGYK